jgi:5-methylcytosine-specific restriction endonuclease McrA
MSSRGRPRPGGDRKRRRKTTLARRDGLRCVYCRREFADQAEATIDHLVPLSLFPTWDTGVE